MMLTLLLCAATATAVRVDFTTQPETAAVHIDGHSRGVTPLTLFDLPAGKHHVRFEKKGYEPVDQFFPVGENGYVQRHADLVAEKGLLLITSEPSGCDVTVDSLSLGQTPRLVTTLDVTKVHRVKLAMPGYQDRTIEVKFDGRIPLVRHEVLANDSGTIEVRTEPAGAKVRIAGTDRGVSPVVAKGVPKGKVVVEVEKIGYRPVSRTVTLAAGTEELVIIPLDGNPGTLWLTPTPENAKISVDGRFLGRGAQTLRDLKPGEYLVRCELEGYDPISESVRVGVGETVNREFTLKGNLGRLELRTNPPGAAVLIDGQQVGMTKAADEQAERSDVLTIGRLKAGEHTLVVRKNGYGELTRRITISPETPVQLQLTIKRIFRPNVIIRTQSGESVAGFMKANSPEQVELETKPGVMRIIPRTEVLKLEFIDETK